MADLAATFTIGAVLGAGWVNSIGEAKKDISLFTRMFEDLKKTSLTMPVSLSDNELGNLEKSRRNLEALTKRKKDLDANKPGKGASEESRTAYATDMRDTTKAIAAARAEVNKLTEAQEAYNKAKAGSDKAPAVYDAIAQSTKRATAAMENLAKSTENFRRSWGSFSTLMRNSFIQISAFIGAQTAFVGGVAKTGEAIKHAASAAGMGVMAYQDLAYSAERVGVSGQQLDAGLRKLNTTLGNAAAGSNEAIGSFSRLGVDFHALLAMPMETRMEAIAEAMQGLGSDTERAWVASRIFGEQGVRLNEILKDGAGNLRAMMTAAREKTYTMTPEEIERSKKFTDVLAETKQSFVSLRTGIGLGVMPALADTLTRIGNWVRENRERITSFFTEFGKRAAGIFAAVFRTVASIGTLVAAFLRIPGAATALVAAFAAVGFAAFESDTRDLILNLRKAIPDLLQYAVKKRKAKAGHVRMTAKPWKSNG